ncbi:MAG: YkgJ family cysteine cluster protein [Bryobacteraceae bacterium]
MDTVRFTCQPGCINCCTQKGFVYLSEDDLAKAAKFTGRTKAAFEQEYVYRTAHEIRLRKPGDGRQCPFLLEHGCQIHPAKPTQCRAFPYWPEMLESKATWESAGKYCPGIGKGPLIQIKTAKRRAQVMREAYPEMYSNEARGAD